MSVLCESVMAMNRVVVMVVIKVVPIVWGLGIDLGNINLRVRVRLRSRVQGEERDSNKGRVCHQDAKT